MPAGASAGPPRLRTIPTATGGARPRYVPAWSTPRGEAARVIGIQGDLVWTVSGPAESAQRGHDVSRGFHLRRPSESLGEPSQVRPTVVSSPPVGRAQSCSPEILTAAHIAMPAPVAPFVRETQCLAPGARTPLAAPAGTCGTRFAPAFSHETASSKERSPHSRPGPPRCRFIR